MRAEQAQLQHEQTRCNGVKLSTRSACATLALTVRAVLCCLSLSLCSARRQNYVEMFLADSDLFTQMFDVHLKRMPDIESALKKVWTQKMRRRGASGSAKSGLVN